MLSTIPATTTTTPASCEAAAASPSMSQPAAAPMTGSRFTNAPASSAGTRAWPNANSQKGSSVPPTASAAAATAGVTAVGVCGAPSSSAATGAAKSAAAANCTAVTAAGSRPASSFGCATIRTADIATDPSTSRSPRAVAPPPPVWATSATPARASA